jgi:surface antigen
MFFPLLPRARRLAAVAALGVAVVIASPAGAQSYGTDRGTCDRSGLAGVFSTSTNNLIGSALGAAAGGLLGSQFGKGGGNTVMTITGVLAGALAGGYVGRQMDSVDQACIGRALEATPTNQTIAWQNPDTNSSYWVTPTRTFEDRGGTPCRDYITNAVIDGRRQQVNGTACRQPDGSWKLAGEQEAAAVAREPLPAATAPRYDDRSGGRDEYRDYSDRDLRDEYRRINEEALQVQQRQELIEREMARRGLRR